MRPAFTHFLLALPLCLLLLQAAEAGDRTYRWTDAQGRAHYSDVKNEKGEPIQVKPSGGVSNAPKDSPAVVAARERECQRRKDQVALYNNSADISETDNLGNTRTYTADERTRLIDKAQKQADEACSPPVATPVAAGN